MRILLVDDEWDILDLMEAILESEGHILSKAPDGATALALLKNQAFDLVITDMIMPGISGMKVIDHVRENCPVTRVIAMSGGDKIMPSNYLEQASASGTTVIIRKPFSLDEFIDAVRSVTPS
jgi:two-component system nitrogen regulation response regulator NtrX